MPLFNLNDLITSCDQEMDAPSSNEDLRRIFAKHVGAAREVTRAIRRSQFRNRNISSSQSRPARLRNQLGETKFQRRQMLALVSGSV